MQILGIIGINLQSLERTGQLSRFTEYYWRHYAENFDRIYIFSEKPSSSVPNYNKCIVIEPRWKISPLIYQLILPFVHREFRHCSIIRVMHMVGALPAVIAKLLWHIPFVATYGYNYTNFVWMSRRSKILLSVKYLYTKLVVVLGSKFATRIIATAPEAFNDFNHKDLRKKTVYLPNGVDTTKFSSAVVKRKELSPMRCIFIGRFEPQKNLFLLIDSLTFLTDIPVTLTLFGDGSLRREIESYAFRKNVRVKFMGVWQHSELPKQLRRHHVFVLPSYEEGHPKSLLEAMSCGLACIGSDVRGINQLIQNGITGLLCDLTEEAFAEALLHLYRNKKLRVTLGRNAQAFVRMNYDLNDILQKEVDLLRNSINQGV